MPSFPRDARHIRRCGHTRHCRFRRADTVVCPSRRDRGTRGSVDDPRARPSCRSHRRRAAAPTRRCPTVRDRASRREVHPAFVDERRGRRLHHPDAIRPRRRCERDEVRANVRRFRERLEHGSMRPPSRRVVGARLLVRPERAGRHDRAIAAGTDRDVARRARVDGPRIGRGVEVGIGLGRVLRGDARREAAPGENHREVPHRPRIPRSGADAANAFAHADARLPAEDRLRAVALVM